MSYGDFTYTPGSNITVIAECWGGSSQGRADGGVAVPGCGGGGGGYSRKLAIALIGGTGYLVRVGAPKHIAAPHESQFGGAPFCLANGAIEAGFKTPGIGGTTVGATGDVKYAGGNGGAYPGDIASAGTGGGSRASRRGNGVDGSTPSGGLNSDGDRGGDGGAIGGNGSVGVRGGGGGGGTDGGVTVPGNGDEGAVVLWEDLGVWPPCGQTPLGTWGTPPPNHFPECGTRAYVTIID